MVAPSLPMRRKTEISTTVMNCKNGPLPRTKMAGSKPFVVCSTTTRRYAPSRRAAAEGWSATPLKSSIKSRFPITPFFPFVVSSVNTKRYVPSEKVVAELEMLLRVSDPPLPSKTCVSKRLTTRKRSTDLQVIQSTSHARLQPASPVLSSLPSRGWTVVDIQPVKTLTAIAADDTLPSMEDAPQSTPNGPRRRPKSAPSSATQSSSPTVIEVSSKPSIDFDDTAKISSPTEGSSVELSYNSCAATINSSMNDSITSSMDATAGLTDSQPTSPMEVSKRGNRTRATIRPGIEIPRTSLSPSAYASRPSTKAASSMAMGRRVSLIRNLKSFVPPLLEDAKASKNPTTQMEIELPRTRKVAGGEAADPRLDRLHSVASTAIVKKSLHSSPSQHAPLAGFKTALTKAIGSNVSRIRNLFIPPLDEGAKVSKNPTTQMEIEMLRTRKKVAGGGMIDPRLDRLNSLAAMKIATKRLGASIRF